jgi:N-acetylmuramoyl-L-alanine amidase
MTNPDRLVIEIRSAERGAPSVAPSVSKATRLSETPATEMAPDIRNPRIAVEAKIPPTVSEASFVNPPRKATRVFEPPPPIPQQPRAEVPRPALIEPLAIYRLEKPLRGVPGPSLTLLAGLTRNERLSLRAPGELKSIDRNEPKFNPTREREALSLPAKANANGDRSLTRVLGLKLGRVVIDAGHGGKDHGTTGPSGLTEKDVVLDISLKLGALLEERLGSEVYYTRKDDNFIPLEDRGPFANDRKADLFISIHANSSVLRTAAGVETYYLSFTTSKSALDVAARENSSSTKSIHDLGDLLKKIALKDKVEESKEFATRVQNSLFATSSTNNVQARNRGIKKAPFVVLIGASMPAVLVEIGFLSNATDEALMKRSEHRLKIAEALYKGIANYAGTLSHFDVAGRE